MVVSALLVSVMVLFVTTAFSVQNGSNDIDVEYATTIAAPPAFSIDNVSADVLWLARCIYSETKRADEQELVAWVVRNRVETAYRGRNTFRDVVLDPWQFSAFNRNDPKRRYFTALTPFSQSIGWEQALRVAHNVYHAPEENRPFAKETRHFYSERSMVGRRAPNWARGKTPVQLASHEIDPRRFRFYAHIW